MHRTLQSPINMRFVLQQSTKAPSQQGVAELTASHLESSSLSEQARQQHVEPFLLIGPKFALASLEISGLPLLVIIGCCRK